MTAAGREQADLSGQLIGDFLLLRRIGEGGMGQVYLAEQVSLKRRVALKLLKRELANNEVSRRRFEAEAMAVAQLTHPNIVQVHAVGEEDGLRYMVLEYVDGRNLRDFIARKGPPDVPQALAIMRQVASALQRAAELGIIHRDIKPENILLTRQGEVKVADFGLSRMVEGQPLNLTQSGVTMGTPLYMSPEQVEGKPLDPRTDLYSFGVTCYHMLAGHPPFEGENAFAVALQHVQAEPVPLEQVRPDLPPALCAIVGRLMAKKPEDRYQSPREVLNDLQALSGMLAGEATRPLIATTAAVRPPPVPAEPAARRSRLTLAGAVAVTLLLAAGAGALLGWVIRQADAGRAEERSRIEDTGPAAGTDPASETPVAQALLGSTYEQEEALQRLIKATENPGKDPLRQRHGAQYRLDLGLLLLREREADAGALRRAEKFFQEQSKSPIEQYALVGQLGEAVVLAFQDKPAESNARFLKLQGHRLLQPGTSQVLRFNPEWVRMIGKAIEHNYRNSRPDAPFPPELFKFRDRLAFMAGLPPPPDIRPLDSRPKPPIKKPGTAPTKP